ncbi:MAG TPA: Uma2 family endonuclease [Armatimonadota bacterium]|nr:Uma2 family endonuclease [Armatimonadota bacterium]
MTTRTLPRLAAPPESLLPLENGDSLTREEFERRYAVMRRLKKAELLRGVVYMPSPVRLKQHGDPQVRLVTWIGTYLLATPGLLAGDNTTVRLGPEDEPQPDVLLLIPSERGGQAVIGPVNSRVTTERRDAGFQYNASRGRDTRPGGL